MADKKEDFWQEMSSDSRRLLQEEKLALFLDIDNTILHAIITYDVPYALWSSKATKDMFVFQMEEEKAPLSPSPLRDSRYNALVDLDPASPHHPFNLSFLPKEYQLPQRLDSSGNSLPPASHKSAPPAVHPSPNSSQSHSTSSSLNHVVQSTDRTGYSVVLPAIASGDDSTEDSLRFSSSSDDSEALLAGSKPPSPSLLPTAADSRPQDTRRTMHHSQEIDFKSDQSSTTSSRAGSMTWTEPSLSSPASVSTLEAHMGGCAGTSHPMNELDFAASAPLESGQSSHLLAPTDDSSASSDTSSPLYARESPATRQAAIASARQARRRSETPTIESADDLSVQVEQAEEAEKRYTAKPLFCLVKPRPGLVSFLRSARKFFRIYICTFGSLDYATEIRNRVNAMVSKGDKEPQPPALEAQIIARDAHRLSFSPSSPSSSVYLSSSPDSTSATLHTATSTPPTRPSPDPATPLTSDNDSSEGKESIRVDTTSESQGSQAEQGRPIGAESQTASTTVVPSTPPPPPSSSCMTLKKSLKVILEHVGQAIDERMCVCVDDRLDVWTEEDVLRNVLKIHPYAFFFSHPIYELQAAEHGLHSSSTIVSPPKLNLDLSSLQDDALRLAWTALSSLHHRFFHRLNAYRTHTTILRNPDLPSMQALIAAQRLNTLKGVSVVHQGRLVRDILALARYFGASVLGPLPHPTHHYLTNHDQPSSSLSAPATGQAASSKSPTGTSSGSTSSLPSPDPSTSDTSQHLPHHSLPAQPPRDSLVQTYQPIDARATHLLVSSSDPHTCKAVLRRMSSDPAFPKHLIVLTCSWITDCARDGTKIPEEPYLLTKRFPLHS